MNLFKTIFGKRKESEKEISKYEIIVTTINKENQNKIILRDEINIDDYTYNIKRWEIIGHLRKQLAEKAGVDIEETEFQINPIYK